MVDTNQQLEQFKEEQYQKNIKEIKDRIDNINQREEAERRAIYPGASGSQVQNAYAYLEKLKIERKPFENLLNSPREVVLTTYDINYLDNLTRFQVKLFEAEQKQPIVPPVEQVQKQTVQTDYSKFAERYPNVGYEEKAIQTGQLTKEQKLQNDFNKAIDSGSILGFSGTTLTSQQIAKKNLLENASLIPKSETYGTYYKATNKEGTDILNRVNLSNINKLKPEEQLNYNIPKSYQNVYLEPPKQNEPKNQFNILDIQLPQDIRGTISSTPNIQFKTFNTEPLPFDESIVKGIDYTRSTIESTGNRLLADLGFKPEKSLGYINPYSTSLELTNKKYVSLINPISGLVEEYPSKELISSTPSGLIVKGLSYTPELVLWGIEPELISFPYITSGTRKALDITKSPEERLSGGIQAGSSFLFTYGSDLLKLLPKSELTTITKIIRTGEQEPVLGINQLNLVVQTIDEYRNLQVKYTYDIGTLTPKISKSQGRITEVYLQKPFRDEKLIYSGNPFTDKKGYKKSLDLLTKTNLVEKEAKNLLKYTQPKIEQSTLKGQAITLFGDELLKPTTLVKAEQRTIPKIIEIDGIKSKEFESLRFDIKSQSEELSSLKGIDYIESNPLYTKSFINKDGGIYSKLSQAGKTQESFYQITKLKSLGKKEFNTKIGEQIIGEDIKIKPSDLVKSDKSLLFLEKTPEELKIYVPSNVRGFYQDVNFNNPDLKGIVVVKKGFNTFQEEKTTFHEFVHSKTLDMFDEDLNYALRYEIRPSELLAREMEKLVTPEGFVEVKNTKIIELFKTESIDVNKLSSLSGKVIPKERGLISSDATILSKYIEEPIVVTYESPFKISKKIETGSVNGATNKGNQLIVQEFKPLSLIEEAKQTLKSEQTRVANELTQGYIPTLKTTSQIELEPITIGFKQQTIPKSIYSGLGLYERYNINEDLYKPRTQKQILKENTVSNNMFSSLEVQGKISDLTTNRVGDLTSSRFSSLGVTKSRLDIGTSDKISNKDLIKQSDLNKLIDNQYIKDLTKELNTNKVNELYKNDQQLKERLIEVQKQDLVTKQINNKQDFSDKIFIPRLNNKEKKRRIELKKELTYNLFIKKRGKYQLAGTNLFKGQALSKGSDIVLKDLSRTFKIQKTGRTREQFDIETGFTPSQQLYRPYKVKRGIKQPLIDTFIQKQSANLQSSQEKYLIQQAKRLKQFNYLD